MRKTMLAAALAAATGAALLAAPAAGAAPGGVPSAYLNQTIDWKPCFAPGKVPPGLPPGAERLECGSFRTPRNWNSPGDGVDLTIAVSRLRPAQNKVAQGSVLLNPGGPGAPGRTLPLSFLGRSKLVDNLDLVGFDVRGTGDSTSLTCGGGLDIGADLDPRDRSKGNVDLILDSAELTAEYCQVKGGDLNEFVNTEQTVRDLDLLRALLGRDKIDWIGYSGGTWLGAYYATYFPQRVDKFVLDSNTEFTAPWQESFNWQPLGFERRFREDLLPWLARYDSTYHLGATPEAARQTYESLRAKLAANPVTVNGTKVGPVALDGLIVNALYAGRKFDGLAKSLIAVRAVADKPGDAAAASVVADALRAAKPGGLRPVAAADSFMSTFTAILCNDTPWHGNRDSLIRDSAEQGRKYPLVGWGTLSQPCLSWDRPKLDLRRPTGKGVPPVLMVQDTHDPATPYEGAVLAHRAFANSRLLTATDQGDHGVYALSGNTCVDTVVEAFLVDGKVPAGDLTCGGVPLPAPPTAAAPAQRAGLDQVAAYREAAGSLPR
ncbi:pimeloyl-ACP methyl ester carboxylesterase [Kutzneria viridogrisea]|uniref:Peptidase S33 tripeptidyl aminopeptidase-like C-terminal domain-containing protein n=3 Tax=Pseudonocardiaceae TaxID=2070 RepID=W5WMR7_9PSEU|nr:alpha/beta hydrolase [Kutzneria albida]AHI02071.1 hypothetical protein KALB_8714 [Kutzneria albida DSM 43870]MBA8929368.1 pimeloyl-ACP methyl ester carboxylesterase [Kutzneria viridogrisea]